MKKLFVISILALGAIACAQGGGGRMMGMRNNNSMTGLLNRKDVQGELKMTQEQLDKLAAMRPQRGQGGQGGGGNAGGGGGAGAGGGQGNFDPAQMQQRMMEREKAMLAVLDAGQIKRLRELFVQRAGNGALVREDIQNELGFSSDQKKQVADIQASQREVMMDAMQKMRNGEMEREEMQELMKKNNDSMNEELGKILNDNQASKFKAMRGAEFKFDENGG